MKNELGPYDRPRIFKHAWKWARQTSVEVSIPVSAIFPFAMKAAWIYEKRLREPLLRKQAMDRIEAKIEAISDAVDRLYAQKNA